MNKIKFAVVTISVMAEEDEINNHFEKVEEEYYNLASEIETLTIDLAMEFKLITLTIEED